jgi:hypothetical protein
VVVPGLFIIALLLVGSAILGGTDREFWIVLALTALGALYWSLRIWFSQRAPQ